MVSHAKAGGGDTDVRVSHVQLTADTKPIPEVINIPPRGITSIAASRRKAPCFLSRKAICEGGGINFLCPSEGAMVAIKPPPISFGPP